MRAERRRRGVTLATAVVVALALLPACRREQRRFEEAAFMSAGAAGLRDDRPAGAPLPHVAAGPYRGNAWATGEGARLYTQMNCAGCHFHGGGGMGPPLMDGEWLYGSGPSEVFESIVEGRPNGMPAWKGKLSDQQVWQLVAYVRSLSGLEPKGSRPGREDHMSVVVAPARRSRETPVKQQTR